MTSLSAPAHAPATQPTPALARSAALLVGLSFAGIWAVVLPFVLTGHDVPASAIFLGRLVPLLASLVAWRMTRPMPLRELWRTAGTTARTLVLAAVVALVVMAGRDLLHLGVMVATGTDLAPRDGWSQVLLMLVPVMLVSTLSTVGEEVAWRGHLRTAWEHLGFWPSALAVAAVWLLFHTPLVLAYHLSGVMDWRVNLATWLGLGPVSLLLCAMVDRFRQVWVAVLAHAFPFGVLQQQLLAPTDASVDGVITPVVGDLAFWSSYAAWAAVTLALVLVVRSLPRRA